MQFPSPVSIQWIASFIKAELIGNVAGEATGINEINNVGVGDLVFVDHPKYYEKALLSKATTELQVAEKIQFLLLPVLLQLYQGFHIQNK